MEKENEENSKAIKNININWGLPLPSHIAPFIFSKLSILNLPVCRRVCKSWNHLVLDYAHYYSFSKSQLPNIIILSTCDRISNNPCDRISNNPSAFLNTNAKIHCFDINTLSFVASSTFAGPHIMSILIRNCCNGLFYISKICQKLPYVGVLEGIFNPITYEFFQIPFHCEFSHNSFYQGFGFSTKTKQYKIFLAHPKTTRELKILRLGSNHDHNQWTSIYQPSPVSIRSNGVYMDGVIYWIGIEDNNRNVNNIYVLDVETENFELVMVLEVPYFYPCKLQLFNGTIYAIIYMANPYQVQLWKMQSKHYWIKDFIIPGKHEILHLQLLKAFEGKKILVRIKNHLFWLKNGKKIEKEDKIKRLIPRNRQFTYDYSCLIDSLHFSSIPNILARND